MNAHDSAARIRLEQGIPSGETPAATVARALIHPTKHHVVAYVDSNGRLRDGNHGFFPAPLKTYPLENFALLDTTDQAPVIIPTGAVFSGATGIIHHLYTPDGNIMCAAALGAGQTISPSIVALGLAIGGDQTDDEGYEVFSHFLGATGRPFIVGKDPAFYMKCKFIVDDVSGIDTLLCGFRRAAVIQGAFASIADYAAIGWNTGANPAAIKVLTGLNGTDAVTDTTQTIADARSLTVEVKVSAGGVVTFRHDAAVEGRLAAPTAVGALTFDNGDPVIPFFHFLNAAGFGIAVTISSWEAGLQS